MDIIVVTPTPAAAAAKNATGTIPIVMISVGNPVGIGLIASLAARALGVQLQLLEVRGPNEFDGAFAAMAKERVGALRVLSDSMLNFHRTRLADLAARSRLPAAYGLREMVEAGGLMSYGPSLRDLFRRRATPTR